MERHSLNVSGKRSVGFYGEEIAWATNRDTNEDTRFEWDDVRVFKIDPAWKARQEEKLGKKLAPYTVGVARCTIMKGDRDRYKVFDAWKLPQVIGIVRSHLPEFEIEITEKLKLNTPLGTLEHESSRSPVES